MEIIFVYLQPKTQQQMNIDLDTACNWLLENAIFSQSEVTDRFDEEDLVKRFREAMEQ